MKQECKLAFIYLSALLYLGGLVFFVWRSDWLALVFWLLALPLGQWLYLRAFPRLSRLMGYGSVADRPAGEVPSAVPVRVTLYTALGCPFCPIVKRRLLALQARAGFELAEVDVTTRPGLLTAKGLRSVPVVEVGERRLVGNATSLQLAGLISASVPARA